MGYQSPKGMAVRFLIGGGLAKRVKEDERDGRSKESARSRRCPRIEIDEYNSSFFGLRACKSFQNLCF